MLAANKGNISWISSLRSDYCSVRRGNSLSGTPCQRTSIRRSRCNSKMHDGGRQSQSRQTQTPCSALLLYVKLEDQSTSTAFWFMSCLRYLLAIAEVNGQLRTGSKAVLAEVLTADVPCPDHLDAADLEEDPVLIKKKDKHCLLLLENQMQQRHLEILQTLVETVFQSGAQFRRIDVMFDRYFQNSTKTGTRKWREKTQLSSGDL